MNFSDGCPGEGVCEPEVGQEGVGSILCSAKKHFNEGLKSVLENVPWCGTCPYAVAPAVLGKSRDSTHSKCMSSGGKDFFNRSQYVFRSCLTVSLTEVVGRPPY